MKKSDPLFPVMQMLLSHLLLIKNPQCWFGAKKIIGDIASLELAVTEELILHEIDELIQEIPPTWWPWK